MHMLNELNKLHLTATTELSRYTRIHSQLTQVEYALQWLREQIEGTRNKTMYQKLP